MPGVPPGRYGYLGPAGTFTEAALRTIRGRGELVPFASVAAALDGVREGDVEAALIPFENSVEGSVPAALDDLATGEPLQITREVLLPVSFALLGRPGTVREDVRTVATHPHAEAQCRRWLADVLPAASVVLSPSTADAARSVRDGVYDAAISAPVAAEHYGLQVLANDVHDTEGAVTRFVLVARPGRPSAPSGMDRTTVVAFIAEDHPGALLQLLTEFAVRGVNLTRIESRPTGRGLGSYCFSVDCEGHVADARVGEALSALRRVCADVRFLGSYPRADGVAPVVAPGTADDDFRAAAAWLDRLRG
ncbi:MAG: prephenate dehydratase [Actinobacteria bacterium]|nr:prephenate dehydratase [Actinomycetota bacterium]MCA1722039.1 prephenate dehydratase [Actinomycetota bacterium]